MSAPSLRELIRRFGLTKAGRGDCPACHYKGTFRVTQRDGRVRWWCASCQDGAAIARVLGGDQERVAPRPRDDAAERKQHRALAIWNLAQPAAHTIVESYFVRRGLPPSCADSPALRFSWNCRHPAGFALPAMLALVWDASGAPRAMHRTFLNPDGSGKASADPPRAALGPFFGGAVRLHPCAPEIVIGEGIETSLAAGLLLGLPAWSAIAAGNLASALILPPEVRAVTIAADRDGPGEEAAERAAARWRAEGRTVHIATPDGLGDDFNDILLRR